MTNDPFADHIAAQLSGLNDTAKNVLADMPEAPKRHRNRSRARAWVVLAVCAAIAGVALAAGVQIFIH